jgi:hypothetical protein
MACDSFNAARAELAAEHRDEPIRLWLHIAARTDIEARHVLQAWTFLRQAGVAPDPEHAKDVLGVVVSVPVRDGHDVLAAYRDGSQLAAARGVALVFVQPLLGPAAPARARTRRSISPTRRTRS